MIPQTVNKKYTPEYRTKLRVRLKELLKENQSFSAIKDSLNKDGFTRPNGHPLNLQTVANQIYMLRHRKKRAITPPSSSSPAASAKSGASPLVTVAKVLSDEGYSDSEKVSILRGLIRQ